MKVDQSKKASILSFNLGELWNNDDFYVVIIDGGTCSKTDEQMYCLCYLGDGSVSQPMLSSGVSRYLAHRDFSKTVGQIILENE